METINSASGLFDQAFSESIIDLFDSDAPTGSAGQEEWTCILGGTFLVGLAMQERIKGQIELNKRVHKILLDHSDPNDAKIYE